MAKIVRTTDFIGKYSITQNNFLTTTLQAFIDKYEIKYLNDLLGVNLATLFYADITTPFTEPDTQIYKDLYNSFASEINGCDVVSDGLKEMLIGFIYFHYVSESPVKITPTGGVVAQNEVSTTVDFNSTQVYENYNEAVKTYRSVQIYINDNTTVYPTYNGKMKSFNHWAI
jgi:hypothetical protein